MRFNHKGNGAEHGQLVQEDGAEHRQLIQGNGAPHCQLVQGDKSIKERVRLPKTSFAKIKLLKKVQFLLEKNKLCHQKKLKIGPLS